MIIQPLTDKNGNTLTNIQIIKMCYNQLKDLKNGKGCKTEKQREESEDKFYRICGGSDKADELMRYMEQFVNEPDEDKAQKLFARSLIPVVVKK